MPSRKSKKKPKVVVVGGYHADLLVHTKQLPLPDKTCLGSRLQVHGGGRGANCAVAAARAGCSVTFVGAVGIDAFGSMAKGLLSQEGIDLSYLNEVEGIGTGVTVGIGESDVIPKLLVMTDSANQRISEDMVNAAKAAISKAELVIVEMEIRHETVWFTMDLANAMNVPLLLDAGSASSLRSIPAKPVFVLVAGLAEALESTRTDTAEEATEVLREAGCSYVALLDGVTDVIFSDGQNSVRRHAEVRGAVDRYGAHECMEVWLALSLLCGNSLSEAADHAIEGMAYCLRTIGGLSAIPHTRRFAEAEGSSA
jgi:ribokinase